jgi:hypothetical protein
MNRGGNNLERLRLLDSGGRSDQKKIKPHPTVFLEETEYLRLPAAGDPDDLLSKELCGLFDCLAEPDLSSPMPGSSLISLYVGPGGLPGPSVAVGF